MEELTINRRRFASGSKLFAVDRALPVGTDRLRIFITPDADDRTDPLTKLTLTFFDEDGVGRNTVSMQGGVGLGEDGTGPHWPFQIVFGVRSGQPFKVESTTGSRAFFASVVIQALLPGDV